LTALIVSCNPISTMWMSHMKINYAISIRRCVLFKFTSTFLYRAERVFVDGRSNSAALCPECAHVWSMSWNWLRFAVALFSPFLQFRQNTRDSN